MKKELKAQRKAALEMRVTATSITRVEKTNKNYDISVYSSFGVATLFLSASPMVPLAEAVTVSNYLQFFAWPFALVMIIGIMESLFSSLQSGDRLSIDDIPKLYKKDVKPVERKLLASVPLQFKKQKNIKDVVYKEKKVCDIACATHIFEEYAVWKHGRVYIEETIRETPYTMWKNSFDHLVDKEQKMVAKTLETSKMPELTK